MRYGTEYRGINAYKKNKQYNLYRILPIIFIVTLAIAIYIGGKIFYVNFIEHKVLSVDDMKYYIDVADSVSEGKAQVNWQEVVALNMVLNKGEKNDTTKGLANTFINNDKSGQYKVLSLNEVIKKLNLNNNEEKNILAYYEKVKGNSLSNEISNDKNKLDFVQSLVNPAIDSYKQYGILPSITMAQAILESGWGESTLATEHNNLFGIKADSRWDGAVATIVTKENYDDVIEASFRKYNSELQSIEDHGKFLYSNARYKDNGVFDAKDYKGQAQALENAGYSTAKDEAGEPIYADKLVRVIQNYNLMLFDTEANRK